jgi:hypothetical protein
LEASHDSKLIESKVDAKAALDQAGAVRARPLVERREDGAKKPGLPARWPQQGGSLQYAICGYRRICGPQAVITGVAR